MNKVEANGIELAYDRFGPPGAETILLIAGLGAQRIRWRDPFCLTLAAKGFDVIRFDSRDVGMSTHLDQTPAPSPQAIAAALQAGLSPEIPYTLEDMAADAIGLLDALSITEAHIIGRSMGGMIAQLAAAIHPQRVISLTSIMSTTGNPELPPAAPDVLAMLMAPAPDPTVDEAGYIAHRIAFSRRIAGSGNVLDEAAESAMIREELRRSHDPAGFLRQLSAMVATGDIRSRIPNIVAPTLVIHGVEDALIPPAAGEDTAACIPDAYLMLIRGMGHDLPRALNDAISDAITANARRGSARGVGNFRN
jgi:pimeloyl-ACP methyl ester carboxylesterase